MNSPIPEKIGRFEITKILGEGGMGVVYLGRDSGTEREVAVKTVKLNAPEDIKKRLRIEGTAGKLDHENIVTVYETGEWNGNLPYIAMQYVPGESLDKLIGGREQLTLLDKLDTIRQVCNGLDYAHLNGVVHRDIKPGNVIRRHDGMVKIVDFGIARVQKGGATTMMTGPLQVIGTLAYMAPERLRGERGDGRVDIFATGILLYFVLTGEEPFTGEASSVMHRLVSEPHPPLSQRLSGYPPALDQILDRALAKYPEDRYSTAQEFAADLAAVIDELNRGRIAGMLEDCKRLIDAGTFRAGADLAQQILRIDPQNMAARELRRLAQRGLDRQAVEVRLRELQAEAAEAVGEKRYDDAIRALEEASRRAPGDMGLQEQLQGIREKKHLHLLKDSLCSEARRAQGSGDLTGAIQKLRRASELDPEDVPLLEELSTIERVVREQAERERTDRLLANARNELKAQRYTDAVTILEDLLKSKVAHPELDALYRQALDGRKNQDTERRRDHVITQVRKMRIDGRYADALSELEQAPEELRSDTMLLRLRRELERDAENSRLATWIAETVDRVLKEALTSLDGALGTLREAMQHLPGEDRFESLEVDLLRRKQEYSNQQRRAACLREAGSALQAGEPERAIQLIEYHLLEFKGDAETEGLLEDARQEVEARRARVRLAEVTAKGRALLEESRFTQAIAFLKPLVEETQNRGLATLLGQAEQGKAEADARVRLVAKRVAELRHEGKLADAIALIESQPAGMLQSTLLQEVLPRLREEQERARDEERKKQAKLAQEQETQREALRLEQERLREAQRLEQEKLREVERRQQEEQKLREEREREEGSRRQAFEDATAKMRALVKDGDWHRAREPLENMQRVYGESEALGQALATFDRDRAGAADRRVGQAIQEAKEALVRADVKAARGALEGGAEMLTFASARLVEEWRRLEKLPVKPPVVKPPGPVVRIDEPRETAGKGKMFAMLGVAAVVVVGAGLALLGHGKKTTVPQPATSATSAGSEAEQAPAPRPAETTMPAQEVAKAVVPTVEVAAGSKPGKIEAPKALPPVVAKVEAKPPLGTTVAPTPPPAAVAAPPPSVEFFRADRSSIERGASTMLHWKVSNAASVEIDQGVGRQLAEGSAIVIPTARTTYRLVANGTTLKTIDVDVTAPAVAATAPAPAPPRVVAETAAAKPTGPERGALMSAVNAFQGTIQQALGKKDKECKQALSAANAALLSQYCGAADRVELAERGCEVSGSEDAARLTCDEELRYHMKDGDSGNLPARISFQFTRVPGTGSWRVTKWDRHG